MKQSFFVMVRINGKVKGLTLNKESGEVIERFDNGSLETVEPKTAMSAVFEELEQTQTALYGSQKLNKRFAKKIDLQRGKIETLETQLAAVTQNDKLTKLFAAPERKAA